MFPPSAVPLVSVILPTYNRASLLKDCIRSVLSQDYAELELLIMDDGSDDQTPELVRSFLDDRIRYFPFSHSGHTGRLKNSAIRKARGGFLAFIDSDDSWKPGKLTKQMQLLEAHPEIGFSITDVTTFQGDQILIDHSYHLQHTVECRNIFEWLKQSRFLVYNPTLVLRKGCLDLVGAFDESMHSGDYHFNMRLAFYYNAGIIYESLLWRRVHEGNFSNETPIENYEEYLATFEYLYAKRMLEKKYLIKARANAFFKMGNIYMERGDRRLARSAFAGALSQNPFRLRAWRQWMASLRPVKANSPGSGNV